MVERCGVESIHIYATDQAASKKMHHRRTHMLHLVYLQRSEELKVTETIIGEKAETKSEGGEK